MKKSLGYAFAALALCAMCLPPSAYAGCGSRLFRTNAYAYQDVQVVHVAHIQPVALFQFTPQAAAAVPAASAVNVGQVQAGFTDAQVEILAKALAKALQPQPSVTPASASAPMPKAQAQAPTAEEGLILTYKAAAIAAVSCMSCHMGSTAKGKTVLFADDGQFDPKVEWSAIAKAVADDHMPQKGAKLKVEEKQVFQRLAQMKGVTP